jgi:hypothetical protein
MFNLGLLSDAALTGLSEDEKSNLQKQATQQFLLGSLLSNDPSMGLKSALSVPDQYLSGQRAISEMQEKRRQRGEVAGFLEEFAPNQQQAQSQALNANLGRPRMASSPYALSEALGRPDPNARVEPQAINQPVDYQRALSASLRLSGNPAQPQIRETLTAMQPKFQGDLRVDASGNVISGLPTMKDGVVSQYNPLTRGYASAPSQFYKESKIAATPAEISTNTEFVPLQGGGFGMQPIPGSTQAVGALEAAKAMAQAQGQVEQVIGADGKTYFVPRSSLLTQRPTGSQAAAPIGGAAGAVAKVSPGQATLDAATNERFKTFSNESLAGANSASGRKIAAQQLYDLSTQIQNNKLTGLQAGAYSYMNAIPGIGKLFEQDITDVTRMNQAIATAQLEKTAQQKGAASNLDAQVIARGYATLTDPAAATRMLAAQEEALADKDIARNQFVENYTGDPGKISTAWGNSPDNKPIFTHPKFNQFLTEQVNTWTQSGAQGKPVLPAGFQFGTGKKSGEFQIKRPDGSIYRIGQ